MTGHRDWASIKAALNGIRAHDDENYIAARSRDYFWYSPILNEQLKDKLGELIVVPQNIEEVVHVASVVARHKVPLTLRGGGTGNYGQCVPLEGGIVMDLTATILAATNSPVPPDARLEGINLLPLLQPGAKTVERTLYFRYTLPARRQRAVRQGDWKLIRFHHDGPGQQDRLELYNLREDPGEAKDLAAQQPERVRALDALIAKHLADTKALVPKKNEGYRGERGAGEKPERN